MKRITNIAVKNPDTNWIILILTRRFLPFSDESVRRGGVLFRFSLLTCIWIQLGSDFGLVPLFYFRYSHSCNKWKPYSLMRSLHDELLRIKATEIYIIWNIALE
jgi:hypothetical protein